MNMIQNLELTSDQFLESVKDMLYMLWLSEWDCLSKAVAHYHQMLQVRPDLPSTVEV